MCKWNDYVLAKVFEQLHTSQNRPGAEKQNVQCQI